MPTAMIDGIDLNYEDSGGDGPPVIFSHGFLMDHTMFAPQVSALTGNFRCISWDQRGHGRTVAGAPFDYWDSARDLLGLMDHLELERAALVGMSQGGFVGLRTALTAAERVKSLAFIDSQAGTEEPNARPVYDALFEAWASVGPTEETAETVAQIIIGPGDHSEWKKKWFEWPSDEVRFIYRALMDRDDLWDRVAEITCPALVIHGDADMAISMDKAQRLNDLLPGAGELVVIPGGAHAANMTHPEEVNRALEEFLAEHA